MSAFTLPEPSLDPLLNLISQYRADTRSNKIDLGVGVYRDDNGHTPVLAAVKTAEARLYESQDSKSYLGLTGDSDFVDVLGNLLFQSPTGRSVAGAQTPGGSGALRLAAELYKTAYPDNTLWVGLPTWPNHLPLVESVGIKTATYPYFSREKQALLFDSMLEHLSNASAGDAVLLHGCCHNPTGADLSSTQWSELATLLADKELIPIVDLAYHGLGDGLLQDLNGTRTVIQHCPQTLVATSCSKNFGLYRDRVGAVYMVADNKALAIRAQAYFGHVARRIYSMPPDHGAAVVKMILTDSNLRQEWQTELGTMVQRLNTLRKAIAAAGASIGLEFVSEQKGMFSLLPLSPEQVDSLIGDHAVYLAGDGRINIAGCQPPHLEHFIESLKSVDFHF
ncbi:hypothetical protein AB833_01760 [Chromatiales bacterium (ex Bugula neritina AB1)]|nr:hypothetical protein AB833_01760 [Chromatiales bacterium (ex Bugula neritina AB1)]